MQYTFLLALFSMNCYFYFVILFSYMLPICMYMQCMYLWFILVIYNFNGFFITFWIGSFIFIYFHVIIYFLYHFRIEISLFFTLSVFSASDTVACSAPFTQQNIKLKQFLFYFCCWRCCCCSLLLLSYLFNICYFFLQEWQSVMTFKISKWQTQFIKMMAYFFL